MDTVHQHMFIAIFIRRITNRECSRNKLLVITNNEYTY